MAALFEELFVDGGCAQIFQCAQGPIQIGLAVKQGVTQGVELRTDLAGNAV